VLARGRVCKPFAEECWLICDERWPTGSWIRTDRWRTHARVCKPEGYCSQAATLISLFPHFRKTLSEKKRRHPVVVLKVLRVLKVLGARKAALALGFKTFWCTDMGLLVCSYGRFGVQIWGFWCAVMGDQARLGVQIWELLSI
jgi:hypothetical protein